MHQSKGHGDGHSHGHSHGQGHGHGHSHGVTSSSDFKTSTPLNCLVEI
jgi:hypothetical protein